MIPIHGPKYNKEQVLRQLGCWACPRPTKLQDGVEYYALTQDPEGEQVAFKVESEQDLGILDARYYQRRTP